MINLEMFPDYLVWGIILCLGYGMWRVMCAIERISNRVDVGERNARIVMNNVAGSAARVASVVDKTATLGSALLDGYIIGTILISVIALVRNVYSRYQNKKHHGEKKESLKEKEVFQLFDLMALSAIIPLFATHGTKSAFHVWGTLTRLCSMIRVACSGISLITKLFDSKAVPFIGAGGIDVVLDTVNDLSDRVEEHKQSGKAPAKDVHGECRLGGKCDIACDCKEHDLENSHEDDNISDIDEKSDHKDESETTTIEETVWTECEFCGRDFDESVSVYANCCDVCKDEGEVEDEEPEVSPINQRTSSKYPISDGRMHRAAESQQQQRIDDLQNSGQTTRVGVKNPKKVSIPIAQPVDASKKCKTPLEPLDQIFDCREDKAYKKNLEEIIKEKPWLLPVVVLLVFACLLLLSRYLHPEKPSKKEIKERSTPNKVKKKRHIVYDDTLKGLYETDEQGNLLRRLDSKEVGEYNRLIREQEMLDEYALYEGPEDVGADAEFAVKRAKGMRKHQDEVNEAYVKKLKKQHTKEGGVKVYHCLACRCEKGDPVPCKQHEVAFKAAVAAKEKELNEIKNAAVAEYIAKQKQTPESKSGAECLPKRKQTPQLESVEKESLKSYHCSSCGCGEGIFNPCQVYQAALEEYFSQEKRNSKYEDIGKTLMKDPKIKKVYLKKCTDVNCKKNCGLFHSKVIAAKAVKAQKKVLSVTKKKKVKVEKKESLVNGPRFDVSAVPNSIAWATSGDSHMNATLLWGGLMLCAHLFEKASETVEITIDGVSKTLLKSDFISVGNDLLFFKHIKNVFPDVKFLRAAVSRVGEKICLIAYDSLEDQKQKKYHCDAGKITSILTEKGEEKAYYTVSSVKGCCGAPVVNVNGKVVGFHNFTTSVDTGFIPVTKEICHLATGATSTF